MEKLLEIVDSRQDWFDTPEKTRRLAEALTEHGFKYLGEGCYRMVVSCSRGYVAKIAKCGWGETSNETELEIWDYAKKFPLVAPLLAEVKAVESCLHKVVVQRRISGKFPSGTNMYERQLRKAMELDGCRLALDDVHTKNLVITRKDGQPKFIDYGDWSIL